MGFERAAPLDLKEFPQRLVQGAFDCVGGFARYMDAIDKRLTNEKMVNATV